MRETRRNAISSCATTTINPRVREILRRPVATEPMPINPRNHGKYLLRAIVPKPNLRVRGKYEVSSVRRHPAWHEPARAREIRFPRMPLFSTDHQPAQAQEIYVSCQSKECPLIHQAREIRKTWTLRTNLLTSTHVRVGNTFK
jgi:hypothetical protein